MLGQDPKGQTCDAMKGLISEGEDIVSDIDQSALRDAGLIAAANRVEHYEIAAYGSARTFAQTLGINRGGSAAGADAAGRKEGRSEAYPISREHDQRGSSAEPGDAALRRRGASCERSRVPLLIRCAAAILGKKRRLRVRMPVGVLFSH